MEIPVAFTESNMARGLLSGHRTKQLSCLFVLLLDAPHDSSVGKSSYRVQGLLILHQQADEGRNMLSRDPGGKLLQWDSL